ncbi:hypothetical protein N656DRAFT_100198 [Canariomyces notabilis]|uniref:Uncharacterized protein n=1 Tax=Canariomyces notabilis TaxID=2074819 RepID=A0AAN6TDV6_9PEZI|nr:hypothetical protein N656DRAFT_100198 [Canariomyces arenarius]
MHRPCFITSTTTNLERPHNLNVENSVRGRDHWAARMSRGSHTISAPGPGRLYPALQAAIVQGVASQPCGCPNANVPMSHRCLSDCVNAALCQLWALSLNSLSLGNASWSCRHPEVKGSSRVSIPAMVKPSLTACHHVALVSRRARSGQETAS